MIRKILLLSLSTLVTTISVDCQEDFPANSTKNIYSTIATALDIMGSTCRSLSICRLVERFKTAGIGSNNLPRLISSIEKRSENNALEPRSYYGGGYGGNTSPAFYPAFDPISILASLAFLAFLLQSFASLFDRSRSIIPAVVSSRHISPHYETPDPMKLVLRALDEYEILNNNNEFEDEK